MNKYISLLSVVAFVLANGAQASASVTTSGSTTQLWAYSPITIALTITSNLPTVVTTGTVKGKAIQTSTSTASEKTITLKNNDIIKYLADRQFPGISGTKYSLEIATVYDKEGGSSAPSLYAVPKSGTASAVLITASLFSTSTSTGESVVVDGTAVKTGAVTVTGDGSSTEVGTIDLLNLEIPAISVQTWKIKYLAAKAYPTAAAAIFPIYEVSSAGSFFGVVDNFEYNGASYSGIASGTVVIGAPATFVLH